MKFKKFNEYLRIYSKSPELFEKMVIFASSEKVENSLFEEINDSSFFEKNTIEKPVVLWNNFKIPGIKINENKLFYNREEFPTFDKILNIFENSKWMTTRIKDRSKVKSLNFPIIAHKGNTSEEFKTFGKFKKSNIFFDSFQEKVIPSCSFELIVSKNKPIHIQEKINGIGFDIPISSFKYFSEASLISKKIYENFRLDFYKIDLLEKNNQVYLGNVSNSSKLEASQLIKLYEVAYENHYETLLPKWFKDQINEKLLTPSLKRKYYDFLLLSPKYAKMKDPNI